MEKYLNRAEAGRLLALELQEFLDFPDTVVLGLPRGGVPVAAQVAKSLHAPLDVVVVRKVGLPSNPEVAMGALAILNGDIATVRNRTVLVLLGSRGGAGALFARVAARETVELTRREQGYRSGRPALPLAGRNVVIVDDGLATGSTMLAAVAAVRSQRPARIVVAVPVGSNHACRVIAGSVDEVHCPWRPDPFRAVGLAYQDFGETSDDEVARLLQAG